MEARRLSSGKSIQKRCLYLGEINDSQQDQDNKTDLFLMREAITGAEVEADLHVVSDGESAVRFIDKADKDDAAPCPDLILLDLNLPKKSGIEVLQHIRRSRKGCNTLILVVTSSDSQNDRKATSELGVNGYFRKPSSYEAFFKIGEIVKDLLTTPPEKPVSGELQ